MVEWSNSGRAVDGWAGNLAWTRRQALVGARRRGLAGGERVRLRSGRDFAAGRCGSEAAHGIAAGGKHHRGDTRNRAGGLPRCGQRPRVATHNA